MFYAKPSDLLMLYVTFALAYAKAYDLYKASGWKTNTIG